MTAYFHCTNLVKPYSNVDANFLATLGDYKEGPPVPAEPNEIIHFVPKTLEQLIADGVVGIYTTRAALAAPAVRKLTGWHYPEKILGAQLAAS